MIYAMHVRPMSIRPKIILDASAIIAYMDGDAGGNANTRTQSRKKILRGGKKTAALLVNRNNVEEVEFFTLVKCFIDISLPNLQINVAKMML